MAIRAIYCEFRTILSIARNPSRESTQYDKFDGMESARLCRVTACKHLGARIAYTRRETMRHWTIYIFFYF